MFRKSSGSPASDTPSILRRVARRVRRRVERTLGMDSGPKPTAPPTPAPTPAPAPKPTPTAAPSSIAAAIAAGETTPEPEATGTAPQATPAEGAQDAIHTADDGVDYWGPIDNESARERAAGKTLVVDQPECIACGTCVENAEEVFVMPDGNDIRAVAITQDGPMDLVQDAIDACPTACIHWTTDPGQFELINDAQGNPA